MEGQINPKIVGATIIGFAFIFGAYVISNFGEPSKMVQPASVSGVADAAPARVSIAVVDEDNNGIEDWRDEFVTTKPIMIDRTPLTIYTPPDTLTGQVGVGLFQNYLQSKISGPFGANQDELVTDTVDFLAKSTEQTVYSQSDITIMTDWDEEDVVNYANTLATTLLNYDIDDARQEVDILYELLNKEDNSDNVLELERLANVYKNYRDDALLLPVPEFLAKEHTDLINSFEAIYSDISAMATAQIDPFRSLLRIKRYEGDAKALYQTMQNLFLAVVPYAAYFETDSPAILFVKYSPDYQSQN